MRQNICAFSAGGCRLCLHPSSPFSQRCLPERPSMLCLLPLPQTRSTSSSARGRTLAPISPMWGWRVQGCAGGGTPAGAAQTLG